MDEKTCLRADMGAVPDADPEVCDMHGIRLDSVIFPFRIVARGLPALIETENTCSRFHICHSANGRSISS